MKLAGISLCSRLFGSNRPVHRMTDFCSIVRTMGVICTNIMGFYGFKNTFQGLFLPITPLFLLLLTKIFRSDFISKKLLHNNALGFSFARFIRIRNSLYISYEFFAKFLLFAIFLF